MSFDLNKCRFDELQKWEVTKHGLDSGLDFGLEELLFKTKCDFLSLPHLCLPMLYQYSDSTTVIISAQGIYLLAVFYKYLYTASSKHTVENNHIVKCQCNNIAS